MANARAHALVVAAEHDDVLAPLAGGGGVPRSPVPEARRRGTDQAEPAPGIQRVPTRTLRELAKAVNDAAFDDAVGVIVLTGAGAEAFCTGGDVAGYAKRYTERPRRLLEVHGTVPGRGRVAPARAASRPSPG